MGLNSVSNVSVGKPKIGGAVFRAPSGTTPPTSATTSLGGTFVNVGYISSDGVVNANSKTSTAIAAWGGDTVAMPQTGHTDNFKLTMIEALNAEALKIRHGDGNVAGSLPSGITVQVDGSEDTPHVYVIDMELNGNIKQRIVIPSGKVSETGDVTYKDDMVISYPVTITALPDSSQKTHYEYFAKASTT